MQNHKTETKTEAAKPYAVSQLAAALIEARAQIIYLHERLSRLDKPHHFTQPTTGTCLQTIDAALAKAGL